MKLDAFPCFSVFLNFHWHDLYTVLQGNMFDYVLSKKRACQVSFQGASLVNVKEMAVGDMVTFDMGFDKKKNRPEALNIHKAREYGTIARLFEMEMWPPMASSLGFLGKNAMTGGNHTTADLPNCSTGGCCCSGELHQ